MCSENKSTHVSLQEGQSLDSSQRAAADARSSPSDMPGKLAQSILCNLSPTVGSFYHFKWIFKGLHY